MNSSFFFSLRLKVSATIISIVAITALVIGALFYFQILKLSTQSAVKYLAAEARFEALRVNSTLHELLNDAFVVSHSPSVRGIIRSQKELGFDFQDIVPEKVWRKRLASTFKLIMGERPHFRQMRLIGLAESGKEIVRVNRTDQGLVEVSNENLQQKGDRPYFRAGKTLKDGDVYFSEISFNKERGSHYDHNVPMIRTVVPVYDDQSALFGIIVINANFEMMLKNALQTISPSKDLFIATIEGHLLSWNAANKTSKFQMYAPHSDTTAQFFDYLYDDKIDHAEISSNDFIHYFQKVNFDKWTASTSLNKGTSLAVIVRKEKQVLFEATNTLTEKVGGVALAILALAVGLAFLFARSLTDPLANITNAVTKAIDYSKPLNLPTQKSDEIGSLSRAFVKLTNDLCEKEAKSRTIIDKAIYGIFSTDAKGIIESCNPSCANIFNCEPGEAIGKDISVFIPVLEKLRTRQLELAETGEIVGVGRETNAITSSSNEVPIELLMNEVQLTDKTLYIGQIRDVSHRMAKDTKINKLISSLEMANQSLENLAFVDQLTGLYNRTKCQDDMNARVAMGDGKFALVQLDLDKFKKVNDTMGHAAGDELLKTVGERFKLIQQSVVSFNPYRWGGDEFIAVIDRSDNLDLPQLCEEITDIISLPVSLEGTMFNPTASLGVARYPEDAENIEELMIFADLALYKTKELGRDGFNMFDAELKQKVDHEALIEKDLRIALEEKQFQLYYQPQVDILSGKVRGVEALLRWIHPEKGIISPGEYLDISEKVGMGRAIGLQVFDLAMTTAKEWTDQGIDFGKISVNLSPSHLNRDSFLDDFFDALENHQVSTHDIAVEILESYLIDDRNNSVTSTITSLRNRGIFVELDDFGTGYASLSHLTSLPVSGLKIDQSFIRNVDTDGRQNSIVKSLITLCDDLDLHVVCEGVESDQHLEALKQFENCAIQGYLIAKPMPKDDAYRWIKNWSGDTTLTSFSRARMIS